MNQSISREGHTNQLYQTVRCGDLRLAFPYGWASAIVESYRLTAVPKAPAWLMGATNIDGRVFPVVDLAYFGVSAPRAHRIATELASSKAKRLLIGGVSDENVDNRLAIAFDDLPQQIGRKAAKFYSSSNSETSAGLTDGTLELATGERVALVNVERLTARLSAELSTL